MDATETAVVDVHSHLWERAWMPEAWWDALADITASQYERAGIDQDAEYIREEYVPTYWDAGGTHLLERMDEAGIDHQVVFSVDFGLALGEPEVPIQDVNRELASFQDEHPERITAFATIDPRRDGAAEHVETAISEWGMRGLKLHPTAGFYLHDEATYEVLSVVDHLDVPVLTDSGPIFAPLYGECSHPNHLDRVLADFPDLDIVAAHMSFGWWRDLLAIAKQKLNTGLRVDISGWQPVAQEDFEQFAHVVGEFVKALGPDRVLFGTDDPVFDPTSPKEDWIQNVRSLASASEDGLDEEAVASILAGGARSLFDSPGHPLATN